MEDVLGGTDTFGQHHAVLWSLIASAERRGLDPQRYLTGVLANTAITPVRELNQFLPDTWKLNDAADNSIKATPATSH